jgi:hypothetical protein
MSVHAAMGVEVMGVMSKYRSKQPVVRTGPRLNQRHPIGFTIPAEAGIAPDDREDETDYPYEYLIVTFPEKTGGFIATHRYLVCDGYWLPLGWRRIPVPKPTA